MDFRNVHYGISLWNYFLLGVVTQAFNPNTQEAEADGSLWVPRTAKATKQTLSQNKQT